ncbi:MAG TPA: DUF1707 domain-containing protein [Pseudonocardiaceae bacterium]|nr:DUF1707 domain-containing protein [Pseudonocardiaceae bacterium]
MTEFEQSDFRIGDAERESAMTALGEHMAAGRLTIDEYGDRSAQVTTAKTRGELFAQFSDLPSPHPQLGGVNSTPPPASTVPPMPPAFDENLVMQPGMMQSGAMPPVGPARSAAHRAFNSLLPLAGIAGIALIVVTHIWLFIFLPAIVLVVGRALLGDQWRQQRHQQRLQMNSYRTQRRAQDQLNRMEMRNQIREQRRRNRGW